MAKLTLGELIRRKRPAYTLAEVAEAAGIDPAALWALRKGLVARPHRKTLLGLAKALGVTREQVFAAIEASRKEG